jgi:hypothetical protein
VQDKLLTLQKRMGELESKHGKDFPILIHSDLSVVDRNLNVISNSFIEYQGRLKCTYIGDWNHPRNQKMFKFQHI